MATKRGRACIACNKIKIKCSLGQDSEGAPPCERCVRLNKDCVLSVPKRQKDRVAELEEQVATLTRLLQAQGIQDPGLNGEDESPAQASSTGSNIGVANKKRRLDEDSSSPSHTDHSSDDGLSETAKLDSVLSLELQESTLQRYLNNIIPISPMVPLSGDISLDGLRRDRPTLLQAIIYGASPGFLPLESQEDVARILLDRLANAAMIGGYQSMDLIQAIQIVCLFYRAPRHHKHVAIYQLIHLAAGLANNISMESPLSVQTMAPHSKCEEVESIDAYRSWLICHILSTSMSIFMRRPTQSKWTQQSDPALLMLEYSPVNSANDRWLGQYCRAERLIEQIADEMQLTDVSQYHELSKPAVRNKVQTCRNKILNWKMMLPTTLRIPTLLLWEHVAMAYMHEHILHTPTNKQSFAAPYVAESLSLVDYPVPVVTRDHIAATYELVSALHGIIDIYSSFDIATILALSGMLFTSRAAYAIYMLSKLHIAISAPGNTLGSIIDSAMLSFQLYARKLADTAVKVRAVDERCGPARILGASERLLEWYASYNDTISSNLAIPQPPLATAPDLNASFSAATLPPPVYEMPVPGQTPTDWETFLQLSESGADFGMDILFAEPLPFYDSADAYRMK